MKASELLRFFSASSSRINPGAVWVAGVKVTGLGRIFVSGPVRPKPHSGKKLEGEGRRASETNRLGSADIRVSIFWLLLLLLLPPYPVPFCVLEAGCVGRANGLGGPCAPALNKGPPAPPGDGGGGGSCTTPVVAVSEDFLADVEPVRAVDS